MCSCFMPNMSIITVLNSLLTAVGDSREYMQHSARCRLVLILQVSYQILDPWTTGISGPQAITCWNSKNTKDLTCVTLPKEESDLRFQCDIHGRCSSFTNSFKAIQTSRKTVFVSDTISTPGVSVTNIHK